MRNYLTLLLFLFCATTTFATHIVGGELSYSYLGNNNYQLTLKVYRDCFMGQAAYDNPTTISIFNSSGGLFTTVDVVFPGSDTLLNNANSPCLIVPPNICVEEADFITTVNLPPIAGGYTLVYQRCCRNSSVQNLNLPSTVGASYYATIPDASIAAINSSPIFTNFPPTVICASVPFTFDHSATDADGDSLVYHLCQIMGGGSQSVPYPVPASAPPFPALLYNAPYTASNPMGGAPPLSINPANGQLTVTPTNVGQFSVGICVDEFRNGIYLGTHYRDFQFNVTPCTQVITAAIGPIPTLCDGLTATFSNASSGGSYYHWDFGLPILNNDTSNLSNPSYTYPSQGSYNVTLVVNPGSICQDTATAIINVHPTQFTGTFIHTDSCAGSPVHFSQNINCNNGTINQYNWQFGDGGISTAINPNHTYTTGGSFIVKLIVQTTLGCFDTIIQVINIYDQPQYSILTPDTIICDLDNIILQTSGTGASNFLWTPNYMLSNNTIANPIASPNQTTTYYFTATSAFGCSITDSVTIYVITNLTTTAWPDTVLCPGQNVQLNAIGGMNYSWQPTTGLSNSFIANPIASPIITTTYIVTASAGSCIDTDTLFIEVKPEPNFNAGPDQYICHNDTAQLQASGGTNFNWQPSSTLSSNSISNPFAFPLVTTTYIMNATDTNLCPALITDSVIVFVFNGGFVQVSNDTTIIFGTTAQLNVYGSNGSSYLWWPSTGLSSTSIANPIANPTITTTYYCQTYDVNGCLWTDSVVVKVVLDPIVDLPNAFSPDGDGMNDLFRPIVIGLLSLDDFRVYNRWGQLVFETNDLQQSWDGTYKGKDEDVGVFVWTLSGHASATGDPVFMKGNVTLLR